MNLCSVIRKLNAFASTRLSESWDNTGLLIEPPYFKTVSKILLTNDLTLDVLSEAEEKKIDFILSYHPPIFQSLKKITMGTWKQRIVGKCLANGIAVYSPHTSYDALKGGVNDWLISPFEGKVTPIHQTYLEADYTHALTITHPSENSKYSINEGIEEELNDNFSRVCQNKDSLQIYTNLSHLPDIVKKLEDKWGKLSGGITLTKNEKIPHPGYGMGRTCILKNEISFKTAIDKVKALTNLSHVRVAVKHGGSLDSKIKSVSVCAGSGHSVLANVKSDLLLTGEMSHHEVLDFTQRCQNVILVEHSNSERGFLKVLEGKLAELFEGDIEILVSKNDRDPLTIF